ncbi:hypothetical protein FOL47_004874, partial [Perkinsus chesapeaki]
EAKEDSASFIEDPLIKLHPGLSKSDTAPKVIEPLLLDNRVAGSNTLEGHVQVPQQSTSSKTVGSGIYVSGYGGGIGLVATGLTKSAPLDVTSDIIPTTILSQFERLELRVQEALRAAREAENRQQAVNEALLRRIEGIVKPTYDVNQVRMSGSLPMNLCESNGERELLQSSVGSVLQDNHVTMRRTVNTPSHGDSNLIASRSRVPREVTFDISTPQPQIPVGSVSLNGGDGAYI